MGKKKTPKSKGGWTDQADTQLNNPFAALQGLSVSSGEAEQAPEPTPSADPSGDLATPKRAVIRFERKGRGGKTVTVVSHLNLGEDALAAWSKKLRQALGCGGRVEGDEIVLQGDLRERVKAELTRQGVRV